MKVLFVALLSLALGACKIGYNPRYYYNNVEIANLTGATISELRVQVGAEGRVVECAEVTNNRICQERFGKRPYPQDIVDLRWRDSSGELQNQQVNPSIPLTLTPGLPIRLIMEIDANGAIKAFFKQDDLRFGRRFVSFG